MSSNLCDVTQTEVLRDWLVDLLVDELALFDEDADGDDPPAVSDWLDATAENLVLNHDWRDPRETDAWGYPLVDVDDLMDDLRRHFLAAAALDFAG